MKPMDENVCSEKNYRTVYEQHSNYLYNFMYYKCGDEAQANDYVQEAFIKLWKNCANVTPQKAKSFLFTVAKNLFLNEVAHQKVVLKHAKLQPEKINQQNPEYLLQEKQFHKKLQNAIANLGEAQRTAFLMNRIDGKKYAEIAEILGISIKAVEKRMSQALKQLREEIKEIDF